jgi:hypothetical protein
VLVNRYWCLTYGVYYYILYYYILYYYIHIHIHIHILLYIIYYYYYILILLLYPSVLFLPFCSVYIIRSLSSVLLLILFQYSNSALPILSFSSIPISFHPIPPIFILDVSGVQDPYLYYHHPSPTILTPHVLSEWMVEVCRF